MSHSCRLAFSGGAGINHSTVGIAAQRHTPPVQSRAKNEICFCCHFTVEAAAVQ